MSKRTAVRIAGFISAATASVGLAAFAVAGTGAYFTDSDSGTISGNLGSISVDGYGGGGENGLDIVVTNMLPGVANSATVKYANDGLNAQDVWVVFEDEGLAALNKLGRYGQVTVASNGTDVFYSANLNADATSCPPGAGPAPVCNPLPEQLRLATNVAPGAGGSMTFTFAPGAQFQNYQGAPVVGLDYKIVATQQGIAPDNALNTALAWD